jgi:hypothetical protein
MEVEDTFSPPILTPVIGRITTFIEEVFSVTLSPEDCSLNFLLCFMGLANALSCSEVCPPTERDDPFICFHFSTIFFGTRSCVAAIAAYRFLETCAMGFG